MHIPCAEWYAWSNTETQRAGVQCLCTSRVQNDTLEATLRHSAQAYSAYAHPVCRMIRLKQHWDTAYSAYAHPVCRMIRLKQHWVTVRKPTVLMHIPCAEWCAWSNTESQCAGPQCLCTSCVQNDALEAALSYSAQAHSAYAHPVCRMMRLKQHWVSAQAQRFRVHIEKFKAQRKEILRCFNLIDLTVLNVSYCACEEPLIVLSTTVLWSNRHLIESNTI